jgi:N-acetylglucosaminyl-diphospho-decaprenol L-rhamnosyltransferase
MERMLVPPDLTISLINHSNPQMLWDCLRSLYAATHEVTLDVWVVDNATDGRLVPEIQAEFPQVHWLVNTQRQGFSANHNQVLRQATGRYACILNDDILVHDGAFDTLIHYMDANPEVGMAGARLLNADGSQQNCTFKFMTLWTELIGICFLPASLCHLKTCGIDPAQTQDSPQMVDWVLGACMIVRDTTLAQVGMLDDHLSPIANTEEVDWCFRAQRAGWRVAYCPAATLTHYGGQSMKSTSEGADRIRVEMYRTRLAFFRKHHGRSQAGLLRVIYGVTLPWNWVMLTQSLLRRRLDRRRYHNDLATLVQIATVPQSL